MTPKNAVLGLVKQLGDHVFMYALFIYSKWRQKI